MIQYDNGRTLAVLCRMMGSVFPRALPMGLMSGAMGTVLAVLRRADIWDFWMEDYLDSSFAIFILGTTIGYLLVMRVNMALERWMNAMTEIEVMLSRWADAYNALTSFFAGTKRPEMERIKLFRVRMAHWFTLMACLVFGTLRGRGLKSLRSLEIRPVYPLDAEATTFSKRRSEASQASFHKPPPRVNALGGMVPAASIQSDDPRVKQKASIKKLAAATGRDHFVVLHAPSIEEVALLEPSSDKVNTICLWIFQAIMIEVRAKTLDAPPPIVTRVFQEISAGMLGFQQAFKVSMVPFPFPFSQIMALILAVLYVTFPFFIDSFTKNIIMTPVMCFVVPMCYCSLNQLSIELEDPFSYSVNDIEIEHMNLEFVQIIEDTLWGTLEPPMKPGRLLESNIANGILDERGDYNAQAVGVGSTNSFLGSQPSLG